MKILILSLLLLSQFALSHFATAQEMTLNESLIKAVSEDNVEEVKQLININNSPSRFADKVKNFFRRKNILNIKDSKGYFLIDIAIQNNSFKMTEFLISEGADVRPELFYSATDHDKLNVEIVELLINAGALSHIKSVTVAQGSIPDLNLSLLTAAVAIDKVSPRLAIPLVYAASKVKYSGHWTLFHEMTNQQNQEIVGVLAKHDSQHSNIKDSNGDTPRDIAIKNKNKPIIEILKRALDRALYQAVVEDNSLVATRKFIEQGANANASFFNWPILFYSIRKNNLKIAEILIDYGADVNHKGHFNTTPLHVAINNIDLENSDNYELRAVKILTDNGADVNTQDDYGRTPLDLMNSKPALTKGAIEVRNYIIEILEVYDALTGEDLQKAKVANAKAASEKAAKVARAKVAKAARAKVTKLKTASAKSTSAKDKTLKTNKSSCKDTFK